MSLQRTLSEYGVRGSETFISTNIPGYGIEQEYDVISIVDNNSVSTTPKPRLGQGGRIAQKFSSVSLGATMVFYSGLDGGKWLDMFLRKVRGENVPLFDMQVKTEDSASSHAIGRQLLSLIGCELTNCTVLNGNASDDWQQTTIEFVYQDIVPNKRFNRIERRLSTT